MENAALNGADKGQLMTGPDTTAPDPAAAPLPGPGQETLTAPAPPTSAGRGRRRWVIGGLAAAALAGLAAGTATSWRQAGLNPASTYHDRVIAVRGGKHSPASATLTLKTLTPPLSQARLQSMWSVYFSHVHGTNATLRNTRGGSLLWTFTPVCQAGACNVILHGQMGTHSFTMKMTRTGTLYSGEAFDSANRCGSGDTSVPDPLAMAIRIHVTAASGAGQIWAATSWAGTMAGVTQYVPAANFYCPASQFTAAISTSG